MQRADGFPAARVEVNARPARAERIVIPPHSMPLLVYVLSAATTEFMATIRSRHVR